MLRGERSVETPQAGFTPGLFYFIVGPRVLRMKTSLVVSIIVALVLVGCGDNSSKPSQSGTNAPVTNASAASSGSVITAPVDYLGALAKAKQTAEKTVDTVSVDKAIQMFQEE